jgi:hypothetical protein
MDLLKAVHATASDKIICVGDLICKGPDSAAVLEWAQSNSKNVSSVVGNHELRFKKYFSEKITPHIKAYDLATYQQLGSRYSAFMKFINTWPFFLDHIDFLVVHAGIDPRRALIDQTEHELTEIRQLADTQQAWYDSYQGSQLIAYGHRAKKDPVLRKNSVGLDTGCVHGGALTALILPERQLVSVPARKVYYPRLKPLD